MKAHCLFFVEVCDLTIRVNFIVKTKLRSEEQEKDGDINHDYSFALMKLFYVCAPCSWELNCWIHSKGSSLNSSIIFLFFTESFPLGTQRRWLRMGICWFWINIVWLVQHRVWVYHRAEMLASKLMDFDTNIWTIKLKALCPQKTE